MAKVVKIVALVAVAVAVVVFAAPIAGALAGLGAGIASTATIAAITASVVGVGISLGLTAISTLFRKAPTLSNSMFERLNTSVLASTPRKIVFGRTAAGNDLRYQETWGPSLKNKDQNSQVIALASHRVNAITQFYMEDKLTWQNGSLVDHKDGINIFRVITEGSAANAQPLGLGGYWNRSSTFTGCAYLAINYKLDSKAWPQGIPAKTITVVEGVPVYDPRQDSTRGGNGAHRSNDQNTWAWRAADGTEIGRNPALCLLIYLLGYWINGRLAWGMGVPIHSIDLDNFREYANVCEERVQTAAGGTAQRYTADGVASTSDTHETVISALTAAMGSTKLTDVGGQYCLIGGFDDTFGPKQAFNENDLVGAAGAPTPYSWVPAGPTSETYNIAEGRFADPSELYQLVSWGRIETDNLPDDIPRPVTIDLGFVNRAETCQRIAKQFLAREAKTPGFFTATFGPKAFMVRVGSLITLSLPSQGWNNKLFRVQSQHEVHDMIYQMTLREESPEVYAWDKDEAKPLPATIRPPGYDPSHAVEVEGLRLESRTYVGV